MSPGAKIYSTMNVYLDAQCCQTLLLKESDPLLFVRASRLYSLLKSRVNDMNKIRDLTKVMICIFSDS